MAKKAIWLLIRAERHINEDGAAGEAITPGHLVQGETTILKHATAGGMHSGRFALEREEMGKTIDDAYAVGDAVKIGSFGAGDRVYALLASGQNISAGTYLESAGDGTLRAFGSGVRVARAIESVNNTAGPGAARIRGEVV